MGDHTVSKGPPTVTVGLLGLTTTVWSWVLAFSLLGLYQETALSQWPLAPGSHGQQFPARDQVDV